MWGNGAVGEGRARGGGQWPKAHAKGYRDKGSPKTQPQLSRKTQRGESQLQAQPALPPTAAWDLLCHLHRAVLAPAAGDVMPAPAAGAFALRLWTGFLAVVGPDRAEGIPEECRALLLRNRAGALSTLRAREPRGGRSRPGAPSATSSTAPTHGPAVRPIIGLENA